MQVLRVLADLVEAVLAVASVTHKMQRHLLVVVVVV
jgi:hypothetical protein